MAGPNVLLIMTDEERYPTPYETAEVKEFRRTQLTSRERIRDGGVELHRHYVGSTACVPSRATLFTGQYPSLHGVSQTDGVAKDPDDPAMRWLDPDEVPTMGDWFRAGGYRTHYRGKWHISHADLPVPGTHEGLAASDDDGRLVPEVVEAYRRADRLDPFGFSGWIGREPHGAAKQDSGIVRDGVFAEQVADLFGDLAAGDRDQPWLAVASFVNPHDIAFAGGFYELLLGFEVDDDTVPDIPDRSFPERLLRRPPGLPGVVQGPVAADGGSAAGRQRLPPPLLLPAQARRSGRRSHSRRARCVWHVRRHDRRVHLRPRRHARRPRRDAAEVGPTPSTSRSACRCSSRVRASPPRPAGSACPRATSTWSRP